VQLHTTTVSQSVAWARCTKTAERIDVLSVVEPRNAKHCILLDGSPHPSRRRRKGFDAAFAKLLWPLVEWVMAARYRESPRHDCGEPAGQSQSDELKESAAATCSTQQLVPWSCGYAVGNDATVVNIRRMDIRVMFPRRTTSYHNTLDCGVVDKFDVGHSPSMYDAEAFTSRVFQFCAPDDWKQWRYDVILHTL